MVFNMSDMLKSVVIHNLRGVREGLIEGLEDVNILIGRNGCGKSTVLEAIYMASAWVNPSDSLRDVAKLDYVISRRTGRGFWRNARNVLWYNMNTNEDIVIRLRFNGDKWLNFHVFNFTRDAFESVWAHVPTGDFKFYNFYNNRAVNPLTKSYKGMGLTFKEKLLSSLKAEISLLENVVFIDDSILSNPKFVEKKIWPKLLAKRLDKFVVKVIREGFESDVEDITYMPIGDDYVLALKLSRTTVRVDDLGDGVRSALLLVSIFSVLDKALVLMEDPELHQHPGGLAVLMRFVLKVAKERRLQLIMSTHSIEFVNIVRRLCDELGLRLRVFFLERSSDGVIDVRVLNGVDVDTLLKLGLDPRFLDVI